MKTKETEGIKVKKQLSYKQKMFLPLAIYFILFIGILFSIIGLGPKIDQYRISKGVLDLTGINTRDNVVELNGEWNVYQYEMDGTYTPIGYLNVPQKWKTQDSTIKKVDKYTTIVDRKSVV